MSHEVETMAYANEVPWHGLGARVDGNISVDEMLKASGLDWEVKLLPTFASDPSELGRVIELPRKALVRSTDNRVLTVAGNGWKPLQNSDMLGFMRRYVEAGGATLETAGSLRGGKTVWALARLGHSFDVKPGDKVNGYLLITSPHEVGRAITCRTTTVRVVCANTMAMAEREGVINYTQNHLTEFDADSAHAVIQSAHENLALAEKRARTLDQLKISVEDAVRKVLLPAIGAEELAEEVDIMGSDLMPKKIQQILDSLYNAPGAEVGTGWGVLNSVTHWADHVAGQNNATRMQRAWLGDNSKLKTDVEERLLELAA